MGRKTYHTPVPAIEQKPLREEQAIRLLLRKEYKLSPKETDTALLILAGKQYKEMAYLMSIAMSTVKNRIKTIYEKCGVTKNVELINLIQEILATRKS